MAMELDGVTAQVLEELNQLPRLPYHRRQIVAPDLGLMGLLSILSFFGAFVAFLRYDLR